MDTFHSLEQPISASPAILTIGVFDGVHRGHQQLIGSTVARARELGVQSAVLTFDPHPDLVIHPERKRVYVSGLAQRSELTAALGVDRLIILPFTAATQALSAQEFVAQICAALPLRELWVGYDFALGRRREGNIERLTALGQEFGYTVHPVAALNEEQEPVSSSRIRAALAEGQIETVTELLGHPFRIDGLVVKGDQRGRTIGFPTANVAVDELYMLPGDGVYVCSVMVRNLRHAAVTNVGLRPTFDGVRRTVEAHLLDFSADIYDEHIQVEFLHWLRGERKFNGVQELIAQINADVATARAWLAQR